MPTAASPPKARRKGRQICLLWVLLGSIAASKPAPAQQHGQWSWFGSLGASGRQFENAVDGLPASTTEEQTTRLRLGLNGYILDPALGRFRLALGTRLASFGGRDSMETDELDYRLDVNLLPRGAYNVVLFARRSDFGYRGFAAEDPSRRLNLLVDSSSLWGIRARARRGPFRGLRLQVDQNRIQFPAESGAEIATRGLVHWNRSWENTSTRLTARHSERDNRRLDFRTRDLELRWDQSAQFGEHWDWGLFLNGLERSVDFERAPTQVFETWTLRQNATRTMNHGDQLGLSYLVGVLQGSVRRVAHDVRVRYLVSRWENWTLGPTLSIAFQDQPDQTFWSPQLGLSATWQGQWGPFDVTAQEGLFVRSSRVSATGPNGRSDESTAFAGSLGLALAHGMTWKKELELSWDANRISDVTEADPTLPDLGTSLQLSPEEDRWKGRFALRRRWRTWNFDSFGDWSRRQGRSGFSQDSRLDQVLVSTTASVGRVAATLNVNEVRGEAADGVRQEISSFSGSLSLRPWRFLDLRGSHRVHERRPTLGPALDGESTTLEISFRFGAFVVEARAFRTQEAILQGRERTNEGLTWSIQRNIGGLLPFVTAVQRRGTIR